MFELKENEYAIEDVKIDMGIFVHLNCTTISFTTNDGVLVACVEHDIHQLVVGDNIRVNKTGLWFTLYLKSATLLAVDITATSDEYRTFKVLLNLDDRSVDVAVLQDGEYVQVDCRETKLKVI